MENELLFNENFIQMDDVYHFIDQLNIGIYLCDIKGNTLAANSNFRGMFSYTMEELKVKTVYDLFEARDVTL